jgi:hypothetical protein
MTGVKTLVALRSRVTFGALVLVTTRESCDREDEVIGRWLPCVTANPQPGSLWLAFEVVAYPGS